MKQPVLEFRDVSLFSSAVVSIQDFTLTVYKGEYLVIQGADGSGKRLLSRSLHGEIPINHGQILLEGKPYRPASIQHAHQQRVFRIPQNSNLIDNQSIAENIFYNHGRLKPFHVVKGRLITAEANAILREFGLDIDSRKTPAGMSPSMKCILEMIKWYVHDAKIIILDNVLAIAGDYEFEVFLRIVGKMCRSGATILHLSNRCTPEFGFANRCVLLSREGRIARVIPADEFSNETINNYLRHSPKERIIPSLPQQGSRELLRAERISAGRFRDLDFTLCAGEALGLLCDTGEIYGALADVLSGSCSYTGQLYLNEKPILLRSENEAVRLGIGVLSSDTRRMYFPDLDEKENALLPFWSRVSNRLGILQHHKVQALEHDTQKCLDDLRHNFSPSKSEEYMLPILSRYMLYPYRILVLPFPSAVNDAHKENMMRYLAMTVRSKGGGLIVIATRRDRLLDLGCRIIDLRGTK